MPQTNLGRVAFKFQGDYSALTTYAKYDVVFDGESSFVSQIDNNLGNELVDGLNWKYLAKGNNLGLQDLKQDVTDLETDLNIMGSSISSNKLDISRAKKGYYISSDLIEHDDARWAITDYIPFASGQLIWTVNGIKQNMYGTDIWGHILYNSNKEIIRYVGIDVSKGVATWEEGVAFVKFDIYNYQTGNHQINVGSEPTEYHKYLEKIDSLLFPISTTQKTIKGDVVAEIKIGDNITEIHNGVSSELNNLLYEQTVTVNSFPFAGFLGKYGNINTSQTLWSTSDFISIKGIEKLYTKLLYGNTYGGGVCFYDSNRLFLHWEGNATTEGTQEKIIESIPDGASYIRCCALASDIPISYAILASEAGRVLDIEKKVKSISNSFLSAKSDSMTTGSRLTINASNVKNWHNYSFFAKVISINTIEITHSTGLYTFGRIKVDATNLYQLNNDGTIAYTYAHGLTISDYIHIYINVKDDIYNASVSILTSNNQSFKNDNVAWHACEGDAYVETTGQYENAIFLIGGSAWRKDIWFFGDSYADYWVPKIMEIYGANNFMSDGFSGRNSAEAVPSLKKNLQLGIPKIIVWMLGMNDADTVSAINAEYKAAFDEVSAMCDEMGIKFIPSTIPNTPTQLHTFKNDYIKSSGYEYVDVAKMFDAESAGSTWFAGLLGADNVHPSQPNGAIVLATMLYNNFPEIL